MAKFIVEIDDKKMEEFRKDMEDVLEDSYELDKLDDVMRVHKLFYIVVEHIVLDIRDSMKVTKVEKLEEGIEKMIDDYQDVDDNDVGVVLEFLNKVKE